MYYYKLLYTLITPYIDSLHIQFKYILRCHEINMVLYLF